MNPVAALLVLVALVVVTTVLGLVWRARSGRIRAADGIRVSADELGDDVHFGDDATIVEFSTEFCGPCRIAERVLGGVAEKHDGVAFVDVDLAARPHLASRFGVVQTPTILLLDAAGGIRARISGVPRAADVEEQLATIAEETHVVVS
ncbi:thioredoxin family protein [Humibacter ginsenosidimutans]|uniref:Thioredoxin family protein n=1 Tax=Humibacter ginsenosidimutans TaxID=2599293 RepID=A0A5B8M1E2_9MICO|nr:thioredoxin family protein [Humibacter ginsenosidimutans]QDZ13510.1 thioredoxin family protein [Humibacter ginsenosidimutans]